MRVDPPAVERRPPPVGARARGSRRARACAAAGRRPRRPMPERRRDEPVAGHRRARRRRPRRPTAASRSTYAERLPRPPDRARPGSAARSFASPMPNSTLTLLGAENVRSKPGTQQPRGRSGSPVAGCSPASTRWNSAPLTCPAEPELRAADRPTPRRLRAAEVVVLDALSSARSRALTGACAWSR